MLAFLLILISVCLTPCYSRGNSDAGSPASFKYGFKPINLLSDENYAIRWLPMDFDGRGNDYLVVISTARTGSANFLNVQDNVFQNIAQLNYRGRIGFVTNLNTDFDDSGELVVTELFADSCVVHAYNAPLFREAFSFTILRRSEFAVANDADWDLTFVPFGVLPPTGDHGPLLLVYANTSFACVRGIFAFDLSDGSPAWQYRLGGFFGNCQLADLDQDGTQEIVGCTKAPGNGCDVNGVSDTVCTVFCLSPSGTELWPHVVCDTKNITFKIADLCGDSQDEIVVAYRNSTPNRPLESTILILDSQGRILRNRPFPRPICDNIEVCDVNFDSRPEILAAFEGTSLACFDSALRPIREMSSLHVRDIRGKVDLNNDNVPELLLDFLDGTTGVFDLEFQELAQLEFQNPEVKLFHSDFGRTRQIVINTATGTGLYKFSLNMPYVWHQSNWIFALAGLLFGAAGVVVALVYRSRSRKALSRVSQTSRDDSARAEEWAAMSRNLAHEVRNPAAAAKLALQNLEFELERDLAAGMEKYRQYTETFNREMDRLTKTSLGFLKFATLKPPNLISTDVAKLIEGYLQHFPFPPDVKITREIETGLPPLMLDAELLQIVVDNLFNNAVRAMEGEGCLNVRAYLVQKLLGGEYVTIEIEDTGCGIEPDKLNSIFDPLVSYSGGTGLGLAAVRKIVRDHGGAVSVQSTTRIGTKFTMELPVR